MENLPGVMKVNDYGPYKELRMSSDADPQLILQLLTTMGSVGAFRSCKAVAA